MQCFYRTLTDHHSRGSPLCSECARDDCCLVCLGEVRPHGFRHIESGMLGTIEGPPPWRFRFETHEQGDLGFINLG